MEPDAGNWISAANEVIGKAILELKKKDKQGLVILVDDLDKMVVRPHGDLSCSTAEYLFVHRAPQLTGMLCHVVYTMPIALAYSSAGGQIRATFGGLPMLPMTKIRKRPPKAGNEPAGIERFREIVRRRLDSVGVNEADLAPAKVLTDLIRLTGGQPTELMYAVGEAMLESLPITQEGVRRVRQERRRYYARMLRKEHLPILADVRRNGTFVRDDSNDTAITELVDSRAVLMYVNDEEWYAETPSISDIPTPESQ